MHSTTASHAADRRSNRRLRLYALIAIPLVIALGLASRKYGVYLPELLADYAGDTLWAWLVYLLVSLLCASRTLRARASTALTVAFLVEFSQLYHAPWIDAIRGTSLGGLALGLGFLWTDLVCYTVGVGLGMVAETMMFRANHK
ncbi:MAG: DUF2809 domain-containing protein [Planctomycetales bacterium]|nr:DUF2809 domain-containing protein [Planctomycetales bacterium]MCA9166132.1 DUF2809 domain-containing protein [Planctomycetales bacterium]